ncbi:cellulase [Tieghemostelium lacteum]|uniref:Cellulase n=1 Tax=Tieghemostelium lacteum TaxID=361077 RepID=A0A151Z565_TIELA|nr:cellulase [Tieghemostelium lacteum]|eukprot:KYQ89119.1 cellulase [Tieghemostelium lacteum]
MNKFTIVTILFTLVLLNYGSDKKLYVRGDTLYPFYNMIIYDSCTTKNVLRVISVPKQICTSIGGGYSLRALDDGTTMRISSSNSPTSCQGSIVENIISATSEFDGTYCDSTKGISLVKTMAPQIPTENYIFLQKYYSCLYGMNNGIPSPTLTFYGIIKPNTCAKGDSPASYMKATYDSNLTVSINGFDSSGPTCTGSLIANDFQLCGQLFQNYNIIRTFYVPSPRPQLTMSYGAITMTGYGSLSVGGITNNGAWPGIAITYSVDYFNGTNYVFINYVVNSANFAITNIPDGLASTTLKIYVVGVDFTGTTTPPSAITPSIDLPLLPLMVNVSTVTYTTTSLTILYNGIYGLFGGTPSFSLVASGIGNILDSTCFTSSTCSPISSTCQQVQGKCSLTGLTPGATVSFDIVYSNSGKSSNAFRYDQKLYDIVSVTSVYVKYTPTSVTVSYITSGGIPNSILFNVTIDGEPTKGCFNTTQSSCEITSLTTFSTYNITVTATSDGFTASNSVLVKLYDDIRSFNMTTTKRTTSIGITTSLQGGDTSLNRYTVYLNDSIVYENQQSTQYQLTQLSPNTQYIVKVVVTNNDNSLESETTVSTYDFITTPTVTLLTTRYIGFTIGFESVNGVPSETVYSVYVDTFLVNDCTDISTTQCIITGLAIGSMHNITVRATNDAYSLSKSNTWTTSKKPQMVDFDIDYYTTKAIQISYTSEFGEDENPVTYTITLDDNINTRTITDQSCVTGNECTISSGLVPGTEYTVSLTPTSNQQSGTTVDKVVTLFKKVTKPILSVESTTKTISANFSSEEGVSSPPTAYSIWLNDQLIDDQICNTSTKHCTLTGLLDNTNYKVQVIAVNDGDSVTSDAKNIKTVAKINNLLMNVTKLTTSILQITFQVNNGMPNGTIYTVELNNQVVTDCSGISTEICTISDLDDDTEYQIKVTAVNDGFSLESSKSVRTFKIISNPIIQVTQEESTNSLVIKFPDIGGVPLFSLYNVAINNSALVNCTDISVDTCIVNNITIGENYAIHVTVVNDGYTVNSATIYITVPYLSSFTVSVGQIGTDGFTVDWSECTGGADGMTTYNTDISVNGQSWSSSCSDIPQGQPRTCKASNLQDDTNYNIRVSCHNTAMTSPKISTSQAKTLNLPESSDSTISTAIKLYQPIFNILLIIFLITIII